MLKFHERFNKAILSGEKTQTIRLDHHHYPEEIHACINPRGKCFTWIKIIKIENKSWAGLYSNEMAKGEGFLDKDDLRRFLEDIYKYKLYQSKLWEITSMYVIHFELTEDPND